MGWRRVCFDSTRYDLSCPYLAFVLTLHLPDIVHFGNAILDNTLFSQAIRDILFTPVVPKDGSKRDYGLGWLVRNEKGHLVVSHSGGAVGASTQLTVFPNDKVVVVILTNLQDVRLYDAARSIGLAWVNKSK
jgi:CubicO group peptidase (beta-lactamase class C family)